MRELEEYFARDGNPVFVLEAIDLARDHEMPLPMWVVSYLFEAAHESMRILEAARAGELILKEGRVGWPSFRLSQRSGRRQLVSVETDERMFWDVVRATDPVIRTSGEKYYFVMRDKLIMAYDIVAAEWGVDRSTVVRAVTRFLRRARVKLEEDQEEEYIWTMKEFVRCNASLQRGY